MRTTSTSKPKKVRKKTCKNDSYLFNNSPNFLHNNPLRSFLQGAAVIDRTHYGQYGTGLGWGGKHSIRGVQYEMVMMISVRQRISL
jgi:hypothetical protein